MMRYTIDRFEGAEWAVLEDEHARRVTIPKAWLPSGAHEGDVLRTSETAEGTAASVIRFELDASARDEQLTRARQQRDALSPGPKGDVSL